MDWQERYAKKIISAEEAASLIGNGQVVRLPLARVPLTIMKALLARRGHGLEHVKLVQGYPAHEAPFWNDGGWAEVFQPVSEYISAYNRPGMKARLVDFLPVDYPLYPAWTQDPLRSDRWWVPDVFLCVVGPPDGPGRVSFGIHRWYSKELALNARLTIAEVDPETIRTGGDNFLDVDEIDYLVIQTEGHVTATAPPPGEEEKQMVEVIGKGVAELVRDGDTIQTGVGTVSEAVCAFLGEKNDLGVHSEVITSSMVELVKRGVINGVRKSMHQGKVVGAMLVEASDLRFVSENPMFELYSVTYTNNVCRIAAQHRQVAVNTALAIDLTGQVAAHTLGPSIYSGIGGQTTFNIGAVNSPGGRSVIALPATAQGGKVSRVVPQLPEGTVVTTPRYYVDFVVTEFGTASLQGKTQRERAEALINIAHPDFRPELRSAARKLFWP